MRRIVLAAATIFALTIPALTQSEQLTIEGLPRSGGRMIFIYKPTNNIECPTIDASATTPLVAPRLARTILAEALVYSGSTVGYVFLLSYSNEGPYEVYFSSYTQRACALRESQSHKRFFVGENFNEAKLYYRSVFNEVSETEQARP